MNRKTKKIFLIIVSALIIFIGASVYYIVTDYQKALEVPNSESDEVINLEIEHGEPIDSVINRLIQKDLLRENYRNYFLLYLRRNDIVSEIQAGSFRIPRDLNIRELGHTLKQAQKPSKWVNIPPGLRIEEIASIVDNRFEDVEEEDFINLAQNSEFITSMDIEVNNIETLEGFLHPGKYLFEKDIKTEYIVKEMVQNFKSEIDKKYTYKDIILASIVEKEADSLEDKGKVADILATRLDEQWLLQTDPTLLYNNKDWNYEITAEDKEKDHVFNTYKYHGLPPQPICNPDIETILQTINPLNTNYYYYFQDNSGKMHYSETLEEHEKVLENHQ